MELWTQKAFDQVSPLLQMGYAKEGQTTRGIHMRLYSRAFVFDDGWKRSVFVSVERNMKCAIGLCGHCQLGSMFACHEGPVVPYDRVAGLMEVKQA